MYEEELFINIFILNLITFIKTKPNQWIHIENLYVLNKKNK